MKPILLDVMTGGRFYTQLRYQKHGTPTLVDGKIVEVHNLEEIKDYVLERCPSLRNKAVNVEFASQKVFIR